MYLKELKEDPSLLGWGVFVWFVIDRGNNTVIGDIGYRGKPNSENTVEMTIEKVIFYLIQQNQNRPNNVKNHLIHKNKVALFDKLIQLPARNGDKICCCHCPLLTKR